MLYLRNMGAIVSILFTGAIFGFFYAWVCSTMWGLDAADPRVAIAAMQAMNASVRNAVFAPAFFGTPFVLAATAVLVWPVSRGAARAFGLAALIYGGGGAILTFAVNVPMNEALATLAVPDTEAEARSVWDAYSPRWQVWNQVRTVASAAALALAAWGTLSLHRAAIPARAI